MWCTFQIGEVPAHREARGSPDELRELHQRKRLRIAVERAESLNHFPVPALENELDQQILRYSQRYDIQTGLLNFQATQDALAGMLRNRADGREVALLWID